jgi:hypothetical protein
VSCEPSDVIVICFVKKPNTEQYFQDLSAHQTALVISIWAVKGIPYYINLNLPLKSYRDAMSRLECLEWAEEWVGAIHHYLSFV